MLTSGFHWQKGYQQCENVLVFVHKYNSWSKSVTFNDHIAKLVILKFNGTVLQKKM